MGMMVAIIEVCKQAFAFLPNIELTSFWMIQFTLLFRWRMLLVIPAVILIEGMIYGFGIWWVMYLYMWPLLVLITWVLRRHKGVLLWCVLSGIFGLLFGLFGAIPYVVIGAMDGGMESGLAAGFTWWVAGIPWDIVHGVGNFVIMFLLYQPIQRVIKSIRFSSI
jgi:energy-coupling factor transport system substrate-specific component